MAGAFFDTASDDRSASSLAPLDLPSIDHGFMERVGGVSAGAYRSFNLARWVGDDPAAVTENWRRWLAEHPAMVPALVKQVHGNEVRVIDRSYGSARAPGDGMVTRDTGIALCLFTADCVPILLADAEHRVVGALHAGWRGALANIVAEGIRAMTALGARSEAIAAALGPAIGMCCFEVDEALAERFKREIPSASSYARRGARGKGFLDLRAIVAGQLTAAGVE
ncbi:MAG: peptidoglycan editing factor PgeF, partial [Candidatus Binataceae bacterium]